GGRSRRRWSRSRTAHRPGTAAGGPAAGRDGTRPSPAVVRLRHRGRPATGEEHPVNTLDEWTAAACAALGLDPATVSRDLVLDLARDVAHGVARPAAPLSTYLVGLAVGRG